VNKTHGMSYTRIYSVWVNMMARCNNPKHPDYHNYGGRGISVCQSWHDFKIFYLDMGSTPEGMSIDRIDNDSGYSKDNCRWASAIEQGRNGRHNRYITHEGERLCLSEWCDRLGGSPYLVSDRLRLGWTEEAAVSVPLRGNRPSIGVEK